ncbi:MAG: sialate O-acetylesterase [Gemmataceae bacterium]|nr:sialate O-acetylesterase [Gemmataceae bacterium]
MPLLRAVLAVAAVGLLVPTALADVKLHPLFTDNMVLQRDADVPVWGTADPGEEVKLTFRSDAADSAAQVVAVKANDKGQWKATLSTRGPAVPGYTLTVAGGNTVTLKNVAVGEVWVCSGQSNMEWAVDWSGEPAKVKAEPEAKNPNLRLFTVKKRTAAAPITDMADLGHFTKWDVCSPEAIGPFSATAYHFGKHLQKALGVPVGLIHTSWGGTPAEAWASAEALKAVPELAYYVEKAKKAADAAAPKKEAVGPNTAASLYNAMIHPLLPFAVKGAIWYQGESNADRAAEYRTLFPTMISDWRARWGSDLPFYCVQLAPWHANDADGVSWAELREAQLHATKALKNVGMAVITDAGDLIDIHPRDKATPGTRLALAAEAGTYGLKVAGSGPVFKDLKVEGGKAILSFDHVGGGLAAKYRTLNGFTVCGEDKEFYPAKARIEGDTVVVTCDKVPSPVAVRYGWKNYPVVNLYNKDGLPATPFRTDDFPLTTATKK